MVEKNEITVETKGTATVFDIKGDVTSASEPFFADAYKNLTTDKVSNILLKFDEEAYINSGGIAVLIQLLAETNRKNQKVFIAGISEHFKKIFHMVGITRFAEIYSSMEDALTAMR